jgi:hypothetical protein
MKHLLLGGAILALATTAAHAGTYEIQVCYPRVNLPDGRYFPEHCPIVIKDDNWSFPDGSKPPVLTFNSVEACNTRASALQRNHRGYGDNPIFKCVSLEQVR